MFDGNFMSVEQALDAEKAEREERSKFDMCTFSNTFLNDCLTGIVPGELVVVGADTGVGKTEFVLDLATINASQEKNVYLFALEGSENEAMSRIKWKLLCQKHFENPDGRDWNYKKYVMGELDVSDYEEEINNKIENLEGLKIYNNKKSLTTDLLTQELGRIQQADIIIIDHLHYMSLDEARNESSQISEVVRMIKQVTKVRMIPIVLVSHLRKKDRFRTLPDNEDFHGSSNIAKEADTCIMICRDPDCHDDRFSKTVFRVTKSRSGGERRFLGKLKYDLATRNYGEFYELYTFGDSKKPEPVDWLKKPRWAKHASTIEMELL